MGWLSGSDPMDYMVLHFKSKEAAIYHCITNGTLLSSHLIVYVCVMDD